MNRYTHRDERWRNQWPHNIRGKSANVVILDEYTDKLGNVLNAHMAEQYKQSALDKLFGVK